MTSDALPNFATGADDFAGPPPPLGFFSPSNHKGALALFVPKQFVPNMTFTFGVKDCCISAVWILVGEGAGAEWPAAEVSGAKMAGQLAARIGGKVLGRIVEQGTGAKKPFVIAPPSEEDKVLANNWLAAGDNRRKVERAITVANEPAQPAGPTGPTVTLTGGLPTPPPVTNHDQPPF